jgi:hypothetical protein
MGIKDKATSFAKRFKLDSHHAIERFGVFFGLFAVSGLVITAGSGAAAFQSNQDLVSHTALYTTQFTTSKTELKGDVDGVYVNENGNRALVMMHFSNNAQISYDALDYQAFLLGSDSSLNTEPVSTAGVEGEFHVFGSTGYVGVLLDADQPFDRQVLNLTMRANAELSFTEEPEADAEAVGDQSFSKYDQWRVFFNPGAEEATVIPALDALTFDPARAFYDVVLHEEETTARDALDAKLLEMRTDLAQIEAYTGDLETTKVDGLFLRPPMVPDTIASDEITGESSSQAENGESTLELSTERTVPGGFDLDWRNGDVYDGYLDDLAPAGMSYSEYLAQKRDEDSDSTSQSITNMEWILSDGSDLTKDYQSSDTTMRPLMNVMNNLSQAYQNYSKHKAEYQSDLTLDLLRLDIDLRDVQSNSTVNVDEKFLTPLY